MEPSENITLSTSSLQNLNETRKCTMFLSIVGFVAVGFLLIVAFFFNSIMGSFPDTSGSPMPAGFGVLGTVAYLLIAVLYFFPIYYLFKFSENMKTGIELKAEANMEQAFSYLKSHYKFMGILTAILLGFYGLVILGSLLFASIL